MTRLNFTSRQRILRSAVALDVEVIGGLSTLSASVDLGSYSFPNKATVVLEARRQTTFMRFVLGEARDPVVLDSEPLTEFGGDASITFTVKVVAVEPDGHGKILGLAKNIRPASAADDRESKGILPFRASDDLGYRAWQLDLTGDEPVVLINRIVGDWNGFARTPEFCALVYPELIRGIALWVVETDPDDDATSPWLKFLKGLGHDPRDAPDEEEARSAWAEEVAFSFSGRHHLLDLVSEGIEE